MLIVSRLSALSFLAREHLTKTSSGGKNVLFAKFSFSRLLDLDLL